MKTLSSVLASATILLWLASSAMAINIVLDYSNDTFFTSHATAKAALEAAAANISSLITTPLAATADTNTATVGAATATFDFDLRYEHPSNPGVNQIISSAAVPANQIRIFVGVRNLSSGLEAGFGGPGGMGVDVNASYPVGGSPVLAVNAALSAANTNLGRGGGPTIGNLNGNLSGNFGTIPFSVNYGSTIGNFWLDVDTNNDGAMDTDAQLNNYWQFDHTAPVPAGKLDFYSVASHEMLHVLGIGTSISWQDKISSSDSRDWLGSQVIGLLGTGNHVLAPDGEHVTEGSLSTRASDGGVQEAVMDPTIVTGVRKSLTLLDLAFLRDIGWQTLLPGDFNGDNHRNAADVQAMLAALTNLNSYTSSHGYTNADLLAVGDLNGDLKVSNADVQSLLDLLKGGGGALQSVPEPGSLLLGCAGAAIFILRSGRRRFQHATSQVCTDATTCSDSAGVDLRC